MKVTLLGSTLVAALLASTIPAEAQSTPIEPGATIHDKINREAINAMAALVRLYGYRCDSVSSALPFLFSTGYTLNCNGYRYTYEIEDRGGNWVATLK